MTLIELLLFLILTILVSSYFSYFGVDKGKPQTSPEVMFMRWVICILVLAVLVWAALKTINYFV